VSVKKRKDRPRKPILIEIYRTCLETHDGMESFNEKLLRSILLRYDPNTLHRLTVSGGTCDIRNIAADTLGVMGHKKC